MTDIVEFIRARLDDDERIARKAAHSNGGAAMWHRYDIRDELNNHTTAAVDIGLRGLLASEGPHGTDEDPLLPAELTHIARHDPARVLREVAAKRRVLERHRLVIDAEHPDLSPCARCRKVWPCPDLLDLALVWSDHSDYDPAWAVDG